MDGSIKKQDISDRQPAPREQDLTVPDLPPRVIVDLRTDCNLKCPMCIVHGDPDNPLLKDWIRRDTDFEKLEKVLDDLSPAKPLMMPSLWSEPLLAKHFADYVRGVKGRGMSIAMNTNGLTLRRDMAEMFVEVELDAVAFSIDSTTPETLRKVRGIDKLDKIKRAVNLMLEVRGDAKFPRVGVTFTIQESNQHEEEEFIEYWVNRVDFVRTSYVFEDGTFPEINVPQERTPCPSLYSTMAIHVDGNVSYCCLDGFAETSVGNVFEDGVGEVWRGEKLNEVRHFHETGQWDKVPFCKDCQRWASYGFEEEIRDDILIRRSPEYTYYNRLSSLDRWSDSFSSNGHLHPDESLRNLDHEED